MATGNNSDNVITTLRIKQLLSFYDAHEFIIAVLFSNANFLIISFFTQILEWSNKIFLVDKANKNS